MSIRSDYAELDEAADLLGGLLHLRAPGAGGLFAPAARPTPATPPPAPRAHAGRPAPLRPSPTPPPLPAGSGAHRSERLDAALEALCLRGGLIGALVCDQQGLPLAAYNIPMAPEALAAFSSAVGESIAKASVMLDEHEANNISIDINYTDKTVLRQFTVGTAAYYLTIVAPQHVDERTEVELSIEQIAGMLSEQ